MSSTTFVDQVTVIPANWCNDVNSMVYNAGRWTQAEVTSGSAVALTSATVTNVLSMTLPAGTYLLVGNAGFAPAGGATITRMAVGASTSSGTAGPANATTSISISSTDIQGIPLPGVPVISTLGGTIYLVVAATFSGGTCGAFGYLGALRLL